MNTPNPIRADQPQRTTLAWLRTLLVLIGGAVLFIKVARHDHQVLPLLLGLVLLLFAVILFVYNLQFNHRDHVEQDKISLRSIWLKRGLCLAIVFTSSLFFIYLVMQWVITI